MEKRKKRKKREKEEKEKERSGLFPQPKPTGEVARSEIDSDTSDKRA